MFDEILGTYLEKGLEIVKKQGYTYKINKYLPPRRSMEELDLTKGRIVRARLLDEKFVEITVCNLTTPF